MNFFSELWQRLKSSTPPFFKKVRAFGETVAATGMGMATAGQIKSGAILFGAGTLVSFVASLACQDPEQLNKNKNKPQ